VPGNHSVTEIQAVMLLSQIARLNEIIAGGGRRREYLNARFADVPGIVPAMPDTEDIKSTWHLYLLQIEAGRGGPATSRSSSSG